MPKGDGPIERSGGDRASLLPGGGLVIAVLAVLLFAAARQVDSTIDLSPPASEPESRLESAPAPKSESESESDSTWAPARVASEPAAVLDPLARRTLEDPVRLSRAGAYTLQIAVACRKDTALRLLDRAGSARDLYVLAARSNGEDCWRFCWGAFAARDRATRAVLPASLASAGLGTPAPRRIDELVP